jgi:Ca2+-binding EF-hand superfamily protein/subtilisin-like proprotein convertase family protein
MRTQLIQGIAQLLCVAFLALCSPFLSHVSAQGTVREALDRLDVDKDGEISPEEITPLARPYLERIAAMRRMSLERSNDIEQFQDAARIYNSMKNGAYGKDVRPTIESTIKPFGAIDDEPLVPEFGLAKIQYPYLKEDLDEAKSTINRYDRNRDGYIDREEARRNRWTHRDPFEMDLNKDGRLSRLELTQRYARRRLLDDSRDEIGQKKRRVGNGIRPATTEERERQDSSQYWRRGGTRYYLTASVMGRFDANRNGRLEASEALSLGIPMGKIDADRNGELSRDEVQAHFFALQAEVGDTTEGLPAWFYELDVDRDGQVEMAEYSTEWPEPKVLEFVSLDLNGDGLLTPSEVVRSKSAVGGSYRNEDADVLPPRKSIISEIEVTEDFVVGDLNIQLSITHTHTDYLDIYITGPDGQRVELAAGVGGSGDNFDQTVFDDQSRYVISKSRAPFKGTFMPSSVAKKQPGLSHFNGKSVQGVWQLVVRGTRSERFGMLHGWGLAVKPQEAVLSGVDIMPEQDGPAGAAGTQNTPQGQSRESSSRESGGRTENRPESGSRESSSREVDAARQAKVDAYKKRWLEQQKAGGEKKDYEKKDSDGKSEKKDYEKKSYDKKSYEKKTDDAGERRDDKREEREANS